jgi:exodeoxyribonuclease V
VTDITPSDQQATAIRRIEHWYRFETRTQQVFRLFGYAGVGKTTITRHAIAELGLEVALGEVLYAAYTGKAALCMTRAGTPASTIHQLLYRVNEVTKAEIERLEKEIASLEAEIPSLSPGARTIEMTCLAALKTQLTDAYKPRFVLNDESRIRDADLIVLDEMSMVPEEMATDLLSFGKPILVLGDPGQLPPIKGEGYFTNTTPDVMLTEIHRQAQDSPIIRLATKAREGRTIPLETYGAGVEKTFRTRATPDRLLQFDQVICGRNATRMQLTLGMRHAQGLTEALPTGPRDKIIVLRNRHDLGVVNGHFVTLDNIAPVNDITVSATVVTEDGAAIGGTKARLPIYTGNFLDHVELDPNRERRDFWNKKGLIDATEGNAITCHKAQGSQWPSVAVVQDGMGGTPEDRSRWLYTAITRAERGLSIYV